MGSQVADRTAVFSLPRSERGASTSTGAILATGRPRLVTKSAPSPRRSPGGPAGLPPVDEAERRSVRLMNQSSHRRRSHGGRVDPARLDGVRATIARVAGSASATSPKAFAVVRRMSLRFSSQPRMARTPIAPAVSAPCESCLGPGNAGPSARNANPRRASRATRGPSGAPRQVVWVVEAGRAANTSSPQESGRSARSSNRRGVPRIPRSPSIAMAMRFSNEHRSSCSPSMTASSPRSPSSPTTDQSFTDTAATRPSNRLPTKSRPRRGASKRRSLNAPRGKSSERTGPSNEAPRACSALSVSRYVPSRPASARRGDWAARSIRTSDRASRGSNRRARRRPAAVVAMKTQLPSCG